jgi:DNA-binding winged helix-turn-helix (wHTH) protein/Tfp pilus assembly protein PilF
MTLTESQTVVRFGVFEANLRTGDLRKKGSKIKVQDLPFRALGVLLSRPNEVVTREEFREALWPQDIFVDFDRGISSAIKRLRDALGDSADNPIFVETVDRRGYRWIAPISAVPVSPTQASATSDMASLAAEGGQEAHAGPVDAPENHGSPFYLLPGHRWAYAAALLVLLFTAWIFIPRLHSAKAGNGPQPLTAVHPVNQEAKDLYLQGRYYWNKRTPDDLQKAVDYFTQAIVHDPGYSDAYVGLADCYNLLREYSVMKGSDAYPRALAASRKAVELDDHSSQAHASFAFASFWGQWDVETADREFRRAVDLDPKNATAHHWYATYLAQVGRYSEALTEIERAQATDPTSKSILADKGLILNGMGKPQEAIALLQRVEAAEPEFLSPHRYLKRIYLAQGDYPDFLAEFRKEALITRESSTLAVVTAAEKGFASGGAHAMFEGMRREQQKVFEQGKLSAYELAQAYARAGDKPGALKYLKVAFDQHDDHIAELGEDQTFDNMRTEPVLRQLVAEINIPPALPRQKN